MITVEISLVSNPSFVLVAGDFPAAPAEGDFVSYEGKRDLYGYVASGRRWTYIENGRVIVRVWLQKDPP